MSDERHAAIIALGNEPISEAGPVGDPVRYDTIFEELQGQMDRIGSLSGEEVEWRRVVELATEILKTKSKDLLVLTYLVVGLLEHEGYAGLYSGLCCYRDFLKKFWEGCYPKVKPPHGRFNAVQYLSEKIHPQIELKAGKAKRQPQANEKEAVHKCVEAMGELDSAVSEVFGSQPETPNLLPLVRGFKALAAHVGPLQPEAPPAPPAGEAGPAAGSAAEGSAGAAVAPAAGGAPGASIPDQFTSATQAVQAIVRVAKYLLSQDNKDPRGYRLMRAVHLGGLREPPKDKLIPGPPAQRRQFFEKSAADGDWPTLLTEAEGQFATTPLWLDMQRYVALAARGLGGAYKPVHDAVAFESVALYSRMPDLFERSFKDGSPFADGATKSWLDEAAGEFGGGGGGGGGGEKDRVGLAISEARKLLAEAKGADAVARLSDAMDGANGRRNRFRAQLALAQFCLDMNKLTLAASLLEGLDVTIERYQLEEWEPDLAAKAVRDLYACLLKLKPKPTPDEIIRQNDVFARLCRLDPAAALKLDGAKPK